MRLQWNATRSATQARISPRLRYRASESLWVVSSSNSEFRMPSCGGGISSNQIPVPSAVVVLCQPTISQMAATRRSPTARRDHTSMMGPSRSDAGGIVAGMGNDGRQPVSDLTGRLEDIEKQLADGTYQAGPWADFLRAAQRRDRAGRRSMTEEVTRVSDKLHRRNHSVTLPLRAGLLIELLGTAVGLIVLEIGLRRACPGCVLAAGMILTVTWQPLLKVAAGYLMGIRYSYFYFRAVEPRVKMQYGTYLASARWRRVMLHLAGTVGSPLAFCCVAVRAAGQMPEVSKICWLLCWILVAVQVVMFVVVLAGARRGGPLGGAHLSSGGSVARELRSTATH